MSESLRTNDISDNSSEFKIKDDIEINKTVSIIVPVYNAGGFLRNCLESLINQTYSKIEIIVIDDGSTDQSAQIADNYASNDARVKVFHKENGGVSSARNLGLKEAIGDYIIFVDADDWIRRDTCEMVLKSMLTADANVCFFNIIMAPVRGRNYLRAPKAETGLRDKKQLMQEVLRNFYPCVNNKCFRRDVLFRSDSSLIEFDIGTRILEDGLWLMETCMNWEKGVVLKDGLSFRRLWTGSVMGNKDKELQNRLEFLITFRRLIPFFEKEGEDLYLEAKEYFMTFALVSVRKATWKSNRKWLAAYAEQMRELDPNYAIYIYADIYNILSQVKKGIFNQNSINKGLPAPDSNNSWNGPIAKIIKKILPYQIKNWLKTILLK